MDRNAAIKAIRAGCVPHNVQLRSDIGTLTLILLSTKYSGWIYIGLLPSEDQVLQERRDERYAYVGIDRANVPNRDW